MKNKARPNTPDKKAVFTLRPFLLALVQPSQAQTIPH
jgi:hypothetical protein